MPVSIATYLGKCLCHISVSTNLILSILAWEPIVINAGSGGSAGYSIKGDNFQWSEQNGFGGWLGKKPPRLCSSSSFLRLVLTSLKQSVIGSTMHPSYST
jgi:hypothetical protein